MSEQNYYYLPTILLDLSTARHGICTMRSHTPSPLKCESESGLHCVSPLPDGVPPTVFLLEDLCAPGAARRGFCERVHRDGYAVVRLPKHLQALVARGGKAARAFFATSALAKNALRTPSFQGYSTPKPVCGLPYTVHLDTTEVLRTGALQSLRSRELLNHGVAFRVWFRTRFRICCFSVACEHIITMTVREHTCSWRNRFFFRSSCWAFMVGIIPKNVHIALQHFVRTRFMLKPALKSIWVPRILQVG